MLQKGSVVKHKGEYCLVLKINQAGFLQLLDKEGNKLPGTPAPQSVQQTSLKCPVRTHRVYNKETGKLESEISYIRTKIGVYSCATGNKIKSPEILKLFEGVE